MGSVSFFILFLPLFSLTEFPIALRSPESLVYGPRVKFHNLDSNRGI
jgi:hypothetical protein